MPEDELLSTLITVSIDNMEMTLGGAYRTGTPSIILV